MKLKLFFALYVCLTLLGFSKTGLLAQTSSGPALPITPETSPHTNITPDDAESDKRQRSNLKIVFKDLRNDKGWLGMLLFNGPEGYPGEYRKAYKLAYKRIENGTVVIDFKDIPFGSYAVTMLHDENANMDMDFNFLGIPKEGYGASNNAARYFGPPRYKDARFEVNQTEQVITIKPIYW
jgi:uncharacterized protein (DUF2141 family)